MSSPDLKVGPKVVDSPSIESSNERHDDLADLDQYDPREIESAWRKVDWHIMPVSVLLYLASYIDRYVVSYSMVQYAYCRVPHEVPTSAMPRF